MELKTFCSICSALWYTWNICSICSKKLKIFRNVSERQSMNYEVTKIKNALSAQPLCRGSARSGIGLVPLYPYWAYAIALYTCTAWLGNRAKPNLGAHFKLPIVPIVRPRTALRTIVPTAAKDDACLWVECVAFYVAVVRCVVNLPLAGQCIAVSISPLPYYADSVEHSAIRNNLRIVACKVSACSNGICSSFDC